MNGPSEPRPGPSRLIPTLGIFSAVMLVAGGVIGSGIFREAGVMAAQIGSPEALLGVWVLAGIVSLLGSLSNAELASMMPQTGGQYVYLQRAYGLFVAFLYGWALFAVIQSGSIAALAYVFAEYCTQIMPLPGLPGPLAGLSFHIAYIGDITPFKDFGVKGLATAVILLLTAVNYLGVRFGGVVQNIFSVAKMAAMVGLRFPTHSSRTRKNRLAPNGAVTVCSNPRPGVLGSAVQAGPARSSLNSTV